MGFQLVLVCLAFESQLSISGDVFVTTVFEITGVFNADHVQQGLGYFAEAFGLRTTYDLHLYGVITTLRAPDFDASENVS